MQVFQILDKSSGFWNNGIHPDRQDKQTCCMRVFLNSSQLCIIKSSGLWNSGIHPESVPLLTFNTPDGRYS